MIVWFLETFPLPDAYKTSNNWNEKIIEKTNFSPLNDEAGEIAEGNKPSKLLINSDEKVVKTWQDVFIEFLKWVRESADYDFDSIVVNQEKLFERNDVIIKWKNLKSIVEEDIEYGKRYKTFDGQIWVNKNTVLTDDLDFVHINASAKTFMTRIANTMNLLGMTDDFIEIVLK